ncbi:MAG: hypothetical protein J0H43_02130 [Actinobacteria bacterium]|nr:hypothetical protein [Actinomycetota bacterium]
MPPWLIPVLIVVVVGVLVAAVDISRRGREPRSDDQHWIGGIFYFNRDDRRLMPPKRFGIGRTLNFAHPGSWLIFLAPIVIAVVSGLSRH